LTEVESSQVLFVRTIYPIYFSRTWQGMPPAMHPFELCRLEFGADTWLPLKYVQGGGKKGREPC